MRAHIIPVPHRMIIKNGAGALYTNARKCVIRHKAELGPKKKKVQSANANCATNFSQAQNATAKCATEFLEA